mgnify:CR=1 FL=1
MPVARARGHELHRLAAQPTTSSSRTTPRPRSSPACRDRQARFRSVRLAALAAVPDAAAAGDVRRPTAAPPRAPDAGYHPIRYPAAINSRPYPADRGVAAAAVRELRLLQRLRLPEQFEELGGGDDAARRAARAAAASCASTATSATLLTDGTGRHIVGVEYVDPQGEVQTATGDRCHPRRQRHGERPAGVVVESRLERRCRRFTSAATCSSTCQTNGVGIFKQRIHGERGSVGHQRHRRFPRRERGRHRISPTGPAARRHHRIRHVVGTDRHRASRRCSRSTSPPTSQRPRRHAEATPRREPVPRPHRGDDHAGRGRAAGEPIRVDLDPTVRDVFGLPVVRLTYLEPRASSSMPRRTTSRCWSRSMRRAGAHVRLHRSDRRIPPRSPARARRPAHGHDPSGVGHAIAFGKLHDFDNLYCMDGGVMPSGSGYNPTLTLITLALRAACQYRSSPGAPSAASARDRSAL